MSWAALDRAVKAIQHCGLPGPEQRWIEVRDDIRARVLQRGVCDAGYFTQYEGTEEVDASLLLLAPSVSSPLMTPDTWPPWNGSNET